MLETFNVLRIDEPDFGCEGRPDGEAAQDRLLVRMDVVADKITSKQVRR